MPVDVRLGARRLERPYVDQKRVHAMQLEPVAQVGVLVAYSVPTSTTVLSLTAPTLAAAARSR
jgi:hypothetical protein